MELQFNKFDFSTDLTGQRELFIDCFPENIGTTVIEKDHYFWKFQTYPAPKKSFEYIATIEDQMVGYYAAIPYRYKIGNKIVNIGMVCDVMTSTKHRGKGIFTKLGTYSTTQLKEEGIPFTMGYPIRKEVIPGHLKIGWEIAFPLPLYIKLLKSNSLLRSKKIGFISYMINPFLLFYSLLTKGGNAKGYQTEIVDNIGSIEGYDKFMEAWCSSQQNALIKDVNFAKWRYGTPGRAYHFLIVRKNNEIAGFVALRKIIKDQVPSIGILDFSIIPDHKKCLGLIHNEILKFAIKENTEAILCMMSKTSAKKYNLCRYGFIKSPYKFFLIIKNLTGQFSRQELSNEPDWHLMWVDSDDL